MIEYEFFPARCAICPYKTDADEQLASLEARKDATIGLGEMFIGEDGETPELEKRTKHSGVDVDMAKARQSVERMIEKEETHIKAVKKEALARTEGCPGTWVGSTKEHDRSYFYRRCQSPQPDASARVDCENVAMFTSPRGQYAKAMKVWQNRPQ